MDDVHGRWFRGYRVPVGLVSRIGGVDRERRKESCEDCTGLAWKEKKDAWDAVYKPLKAAEDEEALRLCADLKPPTLMPADPPSPSLLARFYSLFSPKGWRWGK